MINDNLLEITMENEHLVSVKEVSLYGYYVDVYLTSWQILLLCASTQPASTLPYGDLIYDLYFLGIRNTQDVYQKDLF